MAEEKEKQPKPAKADKAPIIIVKKKGGHGGHHGGAWKVAYADFVTAMMAFFLVMWLVAQSEKVKQNVAKYFEDPADYAAKVKAGLLEGGQGIMENKEPKISVLDQKGGGPWPEEDESQIQNMLEKAGKEIADAIEKQANLKEISKNVEIEITNEGLRIQLIEAGDSAFFDSGSAHLTAKGAEAMAAIAKIVGNLNMDIAVEGHTDSRPFNKNGYTNWELSADRANAARRLLETSGVNPGRIKEVRGYADTRPRYPNAADPRNRRVSIIVFNKVFMQKMAKGVSEPKLINRKPTVGETHTR